MVILSQTPRYQKTGDIRFQVFDTRGAVSGSLLAIINVTLAIEPGVVPNRVRVAVECNPILKGRIWKVSLRDADGEELSQTPVSERQVMIDATLPYGFYTVDLSSDEYSLCRFAFTVELFSLPEALEAGQISRIKTHVHFSGSSGLA